MSSAQVILALFLAMAPVPSEAEPALAPPDWDNLVWFDPGRTDDRNYQQASRCFETPCVLTQDGAIKFNIDTPDRYEINMWVRRDNTLTRVDYFEQRTRTDYALVERVFGVSRNRNVWSLFRRIESGEFDIAYIFGLSRQYRLGQADPIILEVRERDNPDNRRVYFFRYHKAGFHLRLDVALLVPINAVNLPKPNPPYKTSPLNAAVTLSIRRFRDPAKKYSLVRKALLAARPAVFMGLLSRKLDRGEILSPRRQNDLLLGVGFSYLDFIFFGWGFNVINKPRTSSPYLGLEIGKLVGFITELNRSSPTAWDRYLDNERERGINPPPNKEGSLPSPP